MLLVTACGHGKAPTFNDLPTAPPTAAPIETNGASDLTASGGLTFASHANLDCTFTKDDFFARGGLGDLDQVPVYLSLNVEFYKQPGRYAGKVQILLRRVSADGKLYESWYLPTATATVSATGVDIESVALPPEAGTNATAPATFGGHLACAGKPSPGAG
jgi:hypothetical protein